MTKREAWGRYRGSVLGFLWSFITPLVMLIVYTFVFSVVFKAKWSVDSDTNAEFALVLFAGLIFYNFFADAINKSPSIIIVNQNFVKKVVFPLDVLPIVNALSSLIHLAASLTIWIIAYILINKSIHVTIAFIPLIIAPLLLITIGFSFIFSSLGVYIRDLSHAVTLFTTSLLFLSPIFYPIEILPENFQTALHLNPLTFLIDQARSVMIWGEPPDWTRLAAVTAISAIFAYGGFIWFQKTRRGFADVL